jgi:hypothetical protein
LGLSRPVYQPCGGAPVRPHDRLDRARDVIALDVLGTSW